MMRGGSQKREALSLPVPEAPASALLLQQLVAVVGKQQYCSKTPTAGYCSRKLALLLARQLALLSNYCSKKSCLHGWCQLPSARSTLNISTLQNLSAIPHVPDLQILAGTRESREARPTIIVSNNSTVPTPVSQQVGALTVKLIKFVLVAKLQKLPEACQAELYFPTLVDVAPD